MKKTLSIILALVLNGNEEWEGGSSFTASGYVSREAATCVNVYSVAADRSTVRVFSVVLWNTPTVLPSSVHRKPPIFVSFSSRAVYSPRAISGFALRRAMSFR